MKIIVCTGDSHTWGQGATGVITHFSSVCGGERRVAPFIFPAYVNLIRDAIYAEYGGKAYEYELFNLPSAKTFDSNTGCAEITKEGLTFSHEAELVRFFYYANKADDGIEVYCNNEKIAESLPKRFGTQLSYNICTVSLEKGLHTFTIRPKSEKALLYRMELYTGEYAVINSGIGSCPSFLYTQDNWDEYVSVLKPDLAVVEPHTINDWLSQKTPEEYYESLHTLFSKLHKIGCKSVMITVAPIFGQTALPFNSHDFEEYMEVSRKVAKDLSIPYADTNKTMKDLVASFSPEEQSKKIASDNWHPNDLGHRIYAEEAVRILKESGILS